MKYFLFCFIFALNFQITASEKPDTDQVSQKTEKKTEDKKIEEKKAEKKEYFFLF